MDSMVAAFVTVLLKGDPDIIQAIIDAKKRGVAVRIISDKTEAKNKTQAVALSNLKQRVSQ